MPDVITTILILVVAGLLVRSIRVLRRRRRHQLARLREDFVPDWVYFVWADWVTSVSDGDRHWISADRLIRLYHVDPRDCRVLRPDSPAVDSILRRYPWVPILRPQANGNYTTPHQGVADEHRPPR